MLFHDALSNHIDGLVCHDTDKLALHFHQPSFHCSFDELVVSSPFLLEELKKTPEPPSGYLRYVALFSAFIFSFPHLHKDSRGSPLS